MTQPTRDSVDNGNRHGRPKQVVPRSGRSEGSGKTSRISSTAGGRGKLKFFEWTVQAELAANTLGAVPAAAIELKGCPGGSARLAKKNVVFAGLGAVGGVTFSTMSQLGVGELTGFDPDGYEPESFLTQPASPFDAGRLKAVVQGERAHAANPGSRILTAHGFIQDAPLWLLRRADLLITAGDNLEMLVWLGNVAGALGIPLLQGAVHGESWSAFIRAYEMTGPDTACPACAFSQADWLTLDSRHGCDPGTMRAHGIESTRTLPNVCRTAGDLLATEALKVLLGSDGRLADEELAYCLLSHRPMRSRFQRNHECRLPHVRWNLVDSRRGRSETTPAMLVKELGSTGSRPPSGASRDNRRQRSRKVPSIFRGLQLRGETPWISFTLCTGCNRRVPVRQFGFAGMALDACQCGERLVASPVGVRSALPPEDLSEVADVPLSDLRLPPGAAIGLSAGEEQWWFFVGEPPPLNAERATCGAGLEDSGPFGRSPESVRAGASRPNPPERGS